MAANNINSITLTGNLTRDPELRSLASGTSVCSMRIACNTRRKEGQEWVSKPNYFNVTVWGSQGENCAKYLAKGRPIAVSGRIEWREYDGKDGVKREAYDIIAETVQFLGSKDDNGGSQGGGDFGHPVGSDIPNDYQPAPASGGFGTPAVKPSDDIPFAPSVI